MRLQVARRLLIRPSAFFFARRDELKRLSKREIKFRFDMIDDVKVRIDRIERGHTVTRLEGVECRLDVLRAERRDLANTGLIEASVNSYPARQSDGCPPRGTKPEKDGFDGLFMGPRDRRVCIHSRGLDFDSNTRRYEKFLEDHPIGSFVEADVVARFSNKLRIMFDCGLITKLAVTDYVDRWPYCRYIDLVSVHFPHRIEVIVRRVDVARHVVAVSMHGYVRDPGYCNFSAGYRRSYDAPNGKFALLPWNRPRV